MTTMSSSAPTASPSMTFRLVPWLMTDARGDVKQLQRVGFEFPFLDLAGDGYSSFRWAPAQLISATNDIAVEGSRAYGTIVSPAEYEPLCDAYRRLANGNTYFKGTSL